MKTPRAEQEKLCLQSAPEVPEARHNRRHVGGRQALPHGARSSPAAGFNTQLAGALPESIGSPSINPSLQIEFAFQGFHDRGLVAQVFIQTLCAKVAGIAIATATDLGTGRLPPSTGADSPANADLLQRRCLKAQLVVHAQLEGLVQRLYKLIPAIRIAGKVGLADPGNHAFGLDLIGINRSQG